jgi:hypothetical protein
MLSLLLVFALAGCAFDGGQRGSGITSAEGNVASVQNDGERGVAGIHVTVEGHDLETATDENGHFSVRGQFDGLTVLHFERAEDGLTARLEINAPAGGTMTLHDVHIDAQSGAATVAVLAVFFEGTVVGVDCGAARLTLASTQRDPQDTDTYVVDLRSSTLRDRDHQPVDCSALHSDDRLAVDGFFANDGTIGNADVIVER